MADFGVSDGRRFEGDFTVAAAANYAATASERAYVERLSRLLELLGRDRMEPEPLKAELAKARRRCCEALRQHAEEFAAAAVAGAERDALAARGANASYYMEGAYRERRERTLAMPFAVSTQHVNDDPNGPVCDIVITTFDVEILPEKQRFKVEVDKALLVIKTVLAERPSNWLSNVVEFVFARRGRQSAMQASKLNEYLTALAGVARVGLMNINATQTPFAELALAGLKEEFVAREAGAVKNGYVRRLAFAASTAVLVSAALFYTVKNVALLSGFVAYQNFFVLWAGAAIGTWLSFSIRRVTLGFTDLAVLEEDRLNPGLRILFMLGLTTVIGLLFWTGAVAMNIGDFKSDFKPPADTTFALLIGALCGIAERSLASAVARRAEDFAGAIGQTKPVTR